MVTKKKTTKKASQQVCVACNENKKLTEYYISYNEMFPNGRVPMCKDCMFNKSINDAGDIDVEKFKEMLRKIDRPFIARVLEAAIQEAKPLKMEGIARSRKIFGTYFKNINSLNQYKRMTYEDADSVINVVEMQETVAKDKIESMTNEVTERWGVGVFSHADYRTLEDHYQMLKAANPNCDSNQEIFIKSLCHLNLLQLKALKENDTKKYIDANSEYARTFKQAGLKTIQDTDKNADDCWGIFMEQISQYTPEEYYKDKKLYADFDGIGKKFERFVLRPLKNLLCKTNVRDEEFNVNGNKGD